MRADVADRNGRITSAGRGRAFALVAAFVLLSALAGCAGGAGDGKPGPDAAQDGASAQREGTQYSRRRRVMLYTKQEQVDTPLPRGSSILVRASGPVSIVEGDLETMLIRAQLSALTEERRAGSSISTSLDAQGRLVIEAVWPGAKEDSEVAAFEIRLPRGAQRVDVQTAGAVTLSGLRCDAVVSTSNGAVTVADHGAGVHATTSNAQMSFERVSGVVKAETTNGIVLVRECSGPVSAQTSKAAIDIRLASGAAGPIRAVTETGAISLRVGPGFTGTLTMRTSDAPIVVDMKPGAAEVLSRRIDETVVRFGDGPASLATTKSGTVELRVMEQ